MRGLLLGHSVAGFVGRVGSPIGPAWPATEHEDMALTHLSVAMSSTVSNRIAFQAR